MKLLSQSESENDTDGGGDRNKLETDWILMDLRLKYCKFTTEIHGFHNIQSEICTNTK